MFDHRHRHPLAGGELGLDRGSPDAPTKQPRREGDLG